MDFGFDINALPLTDAQKVSLQRRALGVLNAPPFYHPQLTAFGAQADSRPFDEAGGIAYPAPGVGPSVVVTYSVPCGLVAVIDRLAVIHYGGNPPDGTGNVIWRVLINGAGVKGLGAMQFQFGSMSSPNKLTLLAYENDIVTVTVEVPNAQPPMPGGSTTQARLRGFTYPITKATGGGQ